MKTVSKTEFDAFVTINCPRHVVTQPRKERDGEYLYECFDNTEGEELAFISYRAGEATYSIREAE